MNYYGDIIEGIDVGAEDSYLIEGVRVSFNYVSCLFDFSLEHTQQIWLKIVAKNYDNPWKKPLIKHFNQDAQSNIGPESTFTI